MLRAPEGRDHILIGIVAGSAPDGGATFTIDLPIDRENDAPRS